MARFFRPLSGGAAALTGASTFLTSVVSGAVIASLTAPFTGAIFSIIGSAPGQLALSNGKIVAGTNAAVAGAPYSIKVRAQNADNTKAVEETLTFTARQGEVVAPTVAPTITRTADGSAGQTYTSTATGQWVARDYQGNVTDLLGQTGTTLAATTDHVGKTLGVRVAANLIGYAAGPVLGAPVLLDGMNSLPRSATLGAGVTYTLETTNKVEGAGSLRIAIPASTALGGTDFTTAQAYTPADLDVIDFYFDRLTETSPVGSQQIFLSNNAGTGGNYLIGNEASQLPGGRHIALHVSDIPAFQSAAAGTVRIRCGASKGTATATEVVFDAAVGKAKGRPTVLLSFDDGYKTIRSTAYPELTNRGLRATVYPAPSLANQGTGNFEFMTTADLQFLHSAGWDIGCDGTMDDSAVSTDSAAAVAAVNQVRAWIEANVSSRASSFLCWPFGNPQSDAVASAVIAAGFKAARGTQLPGMFPSRFGVGLATRKKYPSQGIGTSTVPSTITGLVDQAILRGQTLSIHMHSFTEATGNSVFIPSSVYTPVLDYIAGKRNDGSLDVLTVSEWWARDGGSSVPF